MMQITHNGYTFNVPENISGVNNAELIPLVLNTESMSNEEKQYWFDILPKMTEEQVGRLFEILDTEKKKLEELEKKYQEEIKQLNEKHLLEWQQFKQEK